jgi:hypothetical protein
MSPGTWSLKRPGTPTVAKIRSERTCPRKLHAAPEYANCTLIRRRRANTRTNGVIFGEADAALSLIERVVQFVRRRPTTGGTESVATRFVRLFTAHGVHRNQIPRLFGHGLTLATVQTDDAVLAVLDDGMLDDAAALFAVRREWLDGADEQIYKLYDFSKQPEEFHRFITSIRGAADGRLTGVLLVSDNARREDEALIVFEEQISEIGDRPVCRYYFCNNWFFSYWKSRAYLTACMATAWRNDVHVMGRRVAAEFIQQYKKGTTFLKCGYDGALPLAGIHWYPEDMALKPDCFLDGLTEGAFGIEQAIKLWLQLDTAGYMHLDLPYEDVRGTFERSLARQLEPH